MKEITSDFIISEIQKYTKPTPLQEDFILDINSELSYYKMAYGKIYMLDEDEIAPDVEVMDSSVLEIRNIKSSYRQTYYEPYILKDRTTSENMMCSTTSFICIDDIDTSMMNRMYIINLGNKHIYYLAGIK